MQNVEWVMGEWVIPLRLLRLLEHLAVLKSGSGLLTTLSGDISRTFLWLCGSHQTGGSAYQEWQEVIAAIIGWGHWVARWDTFKEGLKRSGAKICKSTPRG